MTAPDDSVVVEELLSGALYRLSTSTGAVHPVTPGSTYMLQGVCRLIRGKVYALYVDAGSVVLRVGSETWQLQPNTKVRHIDRSVRAVRYEITDERGMREVRVVFEPKVVLARAVGSLQDDLAVMDQDVLARVESGLTEGEAWIDRLRRVWGQGQIVEAPE